MQRSSKTFQKQNKLISTQHHITYISYHQPLILSQRYLSNISRLLYPSSSSLVQLVSSHRMMLTETMREATPNPKEQLSFFSNLFGMFSLKKPNKKAKANLEQVPGDLLTPCMAPAKPSSSSVLERVFRCFDEDHDGKISPAELRKCMRTVGEELSAEDAEAVVVFMDSDGDGLLGFEDFVKLVGVEEEEEKGRNLREAFGVYEMEGEDCITPKSLRSALERLGQSRSVEECEAMVRRFDLNGDGVISFDEFRVMML